MNTHNQDNRPKRSWLFAAGFLGWFLVNGLLWLLITGGGADSWDRSNAILWVFPANLVIMIGLLADKKTRPIGQGVLAAIGANLAVSLFLNMLFNAACLVPFFFTDRPSFPP